MAEAYRRCQARRGRSGGGGTLPGVGGYNNQRRRSRAVLYHLSGQFEKHNRANRAKTKLQQLNKFSSISGKMPEYKVQEVKKSKFILVHYGIFKIGWDWLILLCTFYTAILVPYNAAFTRAEKKNQRDSIYSDVVVEILFMFDILFNFRTSFVNKSGQVVYEARHIAINYIKGWFLLDLLAAIPFDFLYIFNISADAPVHLLKLARLIRLARLLQKIDRFSQYSALVLALLMSMFTLLAHWLACIWYAIGHEEFEDHSTVGWLYELSQRLDLNVHVDTNLSLNYTAVKPDVLMSYLSALYFTCSSLTSVGFGNVSANTNSEKIFSICAMIVGALMHAVVFGNVTALIQRMYQRRANFHSKTKDLKDFFRAYDIPKPLKQRMQEYFQTMWSMNNGIETAEILKDFPEEMKGELGLHLHKEILNLPIFEEATQGCLKSIALHTRRSFCAPGEFLVHKGDASTYLYLLVSGSMEILKADMVVAILGKGDLFGSDIDFDDPITVCNYDVRSLTYSELQCISTKGLTDVLLLYPDFAEKFSKDIHNELTYNLRQTADDSDEEANSSPKTRVCTLPSISEDDELSGSDEEDDDDTKPPSGGEKQTAEEEETESQLTSQSISSPLLPVSRIGPKIPNGDIQVETLHSPPSVRPWGIRRTSGLINRSSFKDNRKVRMAGGLQAESVEKIIPHIQNLQNEVEGTKSSITKLERKMCKMGQDICAIDRNMREILKHITNVSKMAPLEPLAPLTPVTPSVSNKSKFSFDFSDMTLNDPPHDCKDNESSTGPGSPQYSDASPCTAENKLCYSSVHPLKHKPLERVSGLYNNAKRRSSLQVPLLLNPHELVTRRYSDGTEDKKRTIYTAITASRSDNNFVEKPPFAEYKSSGENSQQSIEMATRSTDFNENEKQLGKDLGSDFMNSLEDVHSPTCKSPLLGRQLSNSCDTALFRDKVASKKVKKSSTFAGFKNGSIPAVNVDSGFSDSASVSETACLLDKTKGDKRERESGTKLSKSCVEIPQKHAKPQAFVKTKSQGFLETEFGAKTPNEVRTVHFLSKDCLQLDPQKLSLDDIPEAIKSPSESELCKHVRINNKIEKDYNRNMSKKPNMLIKDVQTTKFSERYGESSQENLRNDSGNVSLLDTPEGKQTDISDDQPVFSSQTDQSVNMYRANKNEHEKSGSQPMCCDVSPDSLTDISESLKTDSLRTDDDTVLDIETEPLEINDINGFLGRVMEGTSMRSTNL